MTVKRMVRRALLMFPVGVWIGYTVTIAISVAAGGFGGNFYSPVVPALEKAMGGQLPAVVLQYFLCGFLGSFSSLCATIYDIESWSYTRQTAVHFLVLAVPMFIITVACRWLPLRPGPVAAYWALFAGLYLLIWLGMRAYWKRKLRGINETLREKEGK